MSSNGDWRELARQMREEDNAKTTSATSSSGNTSKTSSTNQTSSNGDWRELARQMRYGEDLKKVDDNYINIFVNDVNNFYSSSQSEYEKMGWGNASNVASSRRKAQEGLDYRSKVIRTWLDTNKSRLNEDSYRSLTDLLDSYSTDSKSILDSFDNAVKYYSQFGTEDEYNAFETYYPKYNGQSYDAIQKALSTLEEGEEKDWLGAYQYSLYQNDQAYNSKSLSGLKSYEAQKVAEAETDQNKTWWERIAENFAYGSPDTSLPAAMINQQITNYRNDTSYREMNDEWSEAQKKQFGYLYAEDPNKAYAYAEQVNNQISAYKKYEMQQGVGADASSNGWSMVGGTLGAIATAPTAIGDLLDDFTEYAGRGTITQKNYLTPFEYGQAAQSGIANKLNEKYGTVKDGTFIFGGKGIGDIYSLGVSAANSLVSAYTLGGTGTLVNFIGQGGASGVDDALSRGATAEQALLYGTIVGAAEGVTEMINADNLLKVGSSSTLKNYLLKALNQGIGESIEEGASSIIGNVADAIIMQDKSNLNAAIQKYMTEGGLSKEEATKKAWLDMVGGVIFDAMGGFATGTGNAMTVGGAKTAWDSRKGNQANIDAVKQYGDKTDALIQEGLKSDKDSDSYKLAEKYQKQVQGTDKKAGKAMTGFQIRNLLAANQEQIAPKDLKVIQEAAEKRLTDLGQTEDVAKVAELATKWATGQKLSKEEKSFLATSDYGSRVANELLPKNIESGEFSTAWAEDIGTKQVNVEVYNKKNIDKVRSIIEQMANTEDPAQYKSITERTGTEGRFNVAESGQATIRESGEAFDFANSEVVTVGEGQMTFKTADGTEVYAGDIDFADDNQSFLVSAVSEIENITPAAASAVMHDIVDTAKPLGVQINGIDEAYTYGFHGYSVEDMKSGNFTSNLTDEQMMSAYRLGESARKISDVDADAPVLKMRTAAEAKLTAEQKTTQQKAQIESDDVAVYFENGGTVVKFDEHTGQYDDKRMAAVNTAKFLSKLGIGGKYYFFESYENAAGDRVYKDANGIEVEAPNGIYKDADGSIHIDLNAGDAGQGTALFTMGHELGHFVKAQSKKQFKILGDLVTEAFDKTDMSMHERVLAKQKFLEDKRGKSVSYNEAYEEVVCDAMSTMLTDGSFHEKIMEIKVKDKGLFNTIKKFFDNLISKFKKIYEGLTPDQKDAQDIREMKDMFDRIQTAFAEALVEASDNFRASEQVLTENGIVVNAKTDSGSLESVRYVLNDAERKKAAKALADRFEVTEKEAMEWLKAETSLASLILNPKYSQFLDYEADPNEVAIKQNSDYPQGTVDFSNICKKRREFTQVMNRILRNFPNHVFAATDLAKIRTIMGEEGMTLPCGICYVEDRRQLDTIVAQDFINGLKLYREGSKTRPDGKPFNANQLKGLQLTDGDTYVPTIYELVSLEGRNSLKAKNPNMEAAWVRYNNARGMQAVRLLTNEAEYKRQILNYNKKTVQSKNDHGGLRIYSFSDAEMFHLIDIIQVITDSATVGLSIQGYTKVNEYAKAVKDTGEKLNRSLIPKGDLGYHMENGKVVLDYDTVEGIDIYSEDFFDNKDNPDVGNITIGINDVQIRAAMVSDFVDQIIPFHTGQSEEVLGEKGIAAWDNYKDYQTEKDIATGRTSSHQVNIYTEVFQAAEEEGKPIQNKRQFVEKFLQVCKENGLQPRFAQFLNTDAKGNYIYTEGYHKFLVDFKTFAQTEVGEYLPQMPVKPIFDDAYITGLLEAYVEEQQTKDAEVTKQMPKVIERITNEIVKSGSEIGTMHSDRSVTSWNIAWDSDNNSSLKSQLIAHMDEVNAMSPVTDVIFDKSKGKTYATILNDILRTKFGYKIARQDGVTFLFDETAIGTLRHYVTSDEEAAAVISAPYVLKRGKAISGHKNHKNRGYPSVTYAAPVTINGDKVNVAVSVLFADKDRPHSLRVLMPSGEEYVMQKIKTDPGMEEATPKSGVPSPTGSVSNKKVSQPKQKVNRNSDRNFLAEGKLKGNYTVSEISEMFDVWNSDPELTDLSKKVFAKLQEIQSEKKNLRWATPYEIKFVPNARYEQLGYGWSTPNGLFTDDTHSSLYGISYNLDYFRTASDQDKAKVLLHEAIHACTVGTIRTVERLLPKYADPMEFTPGENWSDAQRAGLELIQTFSQVRVANERNEYGQKNVYEMVAEMANPEFRSMLKKQRLWGRIVDAIKRIFGIEQRTAYDAVSNALEKILELDMPKAETVRYSERNNAPTFYSQMGKTVLDNGNEVWAMAITDSMQESVLKEGQAMYSERGEGASNRHMLANAFEGLSQSSVEYKMIQDYRDHIKQLNELETKLSGLNHEIRKIRFGTEGARDTEKLRKLESEAKDVAKEINRYDKRLLNMEASEPLRKVINRERKKEAEKTKAHVKEIQQNKKARAEQTELRHKIRKAVRDLDKILKHGNKKQNVKEDMKGFASKALELADYLFTDHISNDELIRKGIDADLMRGNEAQLVRETEEILSKLYDNADSLTDEEFTRLDAKRKANETKLKDLLTAQRNRRLNTPVYNLFNDLATEYASLQNSKQDAVKAAYNSEVERFLRSYIGESADGTDTDRKTLLQNMRVADMTKDELWRLYNAYTMVLHSVRNANNLFVKGKAESIEKMAEAIIWDFGSRKIPDKKMAIIARNLANKIGWDYEKLYYALDRIGSDSFTELVMNVANSENIVMQDVMEAAAFRDEMVEKYGFNDWDVNKKLDREFLDNTGKKFKLTLGELMSLYAYSRREGAWDHIEYGGFAFGKNELTNPKPADTYKLSKDQCEAITNLLTTEQKGYVEDMQKFLSETMGEKGNEVSMLLYGIKMFGEKNYFPLHIYGVFKAQAAEAQAKSAEGFQSMSNAGFTHAQNHNAKAPFVLEGFNEVWVDHVNEMSRYHGTVPALEDMRRVMNRSSYSENTAESMAIKQLMENAFGKEAVDYFDNLYREANSGAITDKLQKWSKKLLSMFRKNSVAYSLSVLIQQPASITRAYALINPKYFGFKGVGAITGGVAKAVFSKNKAYANAYNEMLKYAPGVTMAKEIGGFDTATGGSIRSYLLDTDKSFKQKWKTGTALEKGKAVMNLVDDNAIANLPNVADKIAWIEIWNACKRETVATHKDLTPGSEEFMQAVGERFTEVIRATQVYDSMFAKSPMLKSKNLAVQYMVSFMNEPNTTANMAESAVRDFMRGDKKNGARKAVVLINSIIYAGVIKSLIYAMRDDDEDETYIEKYIEALTGSLIDDLLPFNYIPLLRDVWSLVQGYDVERADMAILSDLVDAIEKVNKYSKTDTTEMTVEQLIALEKKQTEAQWRLAESLAALVGIPMKNVRREIKAVINTVTNTASNAGKATKSSVIDAVIESIPFMQDNKTTQDKLYEAILGGDTKYVDRLKEGYKTVESYHSAIRKTLRKNDSRIREAAIAWNANDLDEYLRIAKEIIGEKNFVQDDVVLAIRAEANAIAPDEGETSADKANGLFTMEKFSEAVAQGDTATAKAAKTDIVQTAQQNGKTADEAKESFESSAKTNLKKMFLEGTINQSKAINALTSYCGETNEEAEKTADEWAFQKKYGFAYEDRGDAYKKGKISASQLQSILVNVGGKTEEDAMWQTKVYDWEKQGYDGATTASVRDYEKYCAAADVPRDVYLHIKKFHNNTDNDVDKVTGKKISYSAVRKVMAEIHAQNITAAQKTAIARSLGWAESTIRKYKLW